MSFIFLFQFFFAWTCLYHSKHVTGSSSSDKFTPEDHYEIVTPIIRSPNKKNDHEETLTIQISSYILHLKHEKLPPHFMNIYFKEAEQVFENDFAGCIFDGDVEGFSTWVVSLMLCNGIQGHFGDISDKQHHFHIQPLDPTNDHYLITLPHILYLDSTQHPVNTSLGICNLSPLQALFPILARRQGPMVSQRYSTGQKTVELVLVNDHQQHLRFDQSLSSVVLRNVEIVDYMNELYSEFNISVALVGVITWTERDLIVMPDDMDPVKILVNFKEYYYRIPGRLDSALLISGRRFKENVVGLAYKSAMCYGRYSVGIVQDGRFSISGVGGTAAHELGHILGMSHDDFEGRTCACDDPTGKCVMASVAPVGASSTRWSNCSLADMEASFTMFPATRSCLYNEPVEAAILPSYTGHATGGTVKSFAAVVLIIGLSTIII